MKLRSQNLMRMKQASKIQHVLRDVDIQKASSLFDIDEATLHRLNDQFLLNVEYIREELIKHDWNKLVKGLKYLVDQNQGYTYPEVSKAVCDNYNISRRTLTNILKSNHNRNMVFCKRCGTRISKVLYERTGGLCSNCVAETLDF